jgi:hypothetical protein
MFVSVTDETEIRYDAPVGFSPVAIVVNRSTTSGILWIKGSSGRAEVDLRLGPDQREFTALVVPVPEYVGDGPFYVGIRSGGGQFVAGRRYWHIDPRQLGACAELAELVLFERRPQLGPGHGPAAGHNAQIHRLSWVVPRIRELQSLIGLGAGAAEAGSMVTTRRVLELAIEHVDLDIHPLVSAARLRVAVGDLDSALRDLAAVEPPDPTILKLIDAVTEFKDALAAWRR